MNNNSTDNTNAITNDNNNHHYYHHHPYHYSNKTDSDCNYGADNLHSIGRATLLHVRCRK